MKAVTLLLGLQVVVAVPQLQWANGRPKISTSNTRTEFAAECKVTATDTAWPKEDVWKNAIPNVAVRGNLKAGVTAPDYKVMAANSQEVMQAVKFAAEHNVRLSILNSGHDFLGRNDATSGLGLSVGDIKGIRLSKKFTANATGVPALGPNEKAEKMTMAAGDEAFVTFGAGMSTQLINNAIAPSGLFTLGAAHGEVATAGGWGQAAGHSPLGPRYGLGADAVVEYKVVTADGELKVANEQTNPDLFWALRGGGGGTFGVVTEATVKAFPSPKLTIASWFLNTTDFSDQKSIYAPAAYFHALIPDLVEKNGQSGYYYLFPNAIKSVFLMADKDAGVDKAKAVWEPVLEKMTTFPGINKKTLVVTYNDIPNYKAFFDAAFGSIEEMANMTGMSGMKQKRADTPLFRRFFDEAGITKRHGPEEHGTTNAEIKPQGIMPMDSRLLSREHLVNPGLAEALEKAMPMMKDGQLRGNVVGGNKIFVTGNATAVTPAWRKAYVHLIATGQGTPDVSSLRVLAKDSGAYSNEASRTQENWKTTFWGPNYEKLSQIKAKYDPKGLFWVSPGIGADQFSVQDGKVCRVAPVAKSKYANVAPETDNKNMATGGKSNADGDGFPLLWVGGKIVERPKKGKYAGAAGAAPAVAPAGETPMSPVMGKGS
ncbi:Low-affinity potassium transport protein [Venturia nashicola]|uniref:Low-affinity potassium transport protein n=1 Tax=Venturia nashicola TaxID=86259 RepID=A0A4Z1PU21_9PEZI|nr:Low-affinity potassium transport protein [Venturia nashicola]TLD39565.1 Low-affinity potassium transport protein [Venturia nashicola]